MAITGKFSADCDRGDDFASPNDTDDSHYAYNDSAP
jgi:hypothetical protein